MGVPLSNVSVHPLVVSPLARRASALGGGVAPESSGCRVPRPPDEGEMPSIPYEDGSLQGGIGGGVDVTWSMERNQVMCPYLMGGETRLTINTYFPRLIGP